MITTEAVILAGGFGTRLQGMVADRPKPMALVNGRPFLEYLLDYLQQQGLCRIVLSVGYKHEIIRDHFRDRYKDLKLHYAVENEPLGTGGGLRYALQQTSSDALFVINGDTWFGIPLMELEKLFIRQQADLVMALRQVNRADRYGTVMLSGNGRITGFTEKNDIQGSALINGGTYLLKSHLLTTADLPEKFSFEMDFLEQSSNHLLFFGKIFRNRFIDIGIPESYRRAQTFFQPETP